MPKQKIMSTGNLINVIRYTFICNH